MIINIIPEGRLQLGPKSLVTSQRLLQYEIHSVVTHVSDKVGSDLQKVMLQ